MAQGASYFLLSARTLRCVLARDWLQNYLWYIIEYWLLLIHRRYSRKLPWPVRLPGTHVAKWSEVTCACTQLWLGGFCCKIGRVKPAWPSTMSLCLTLTSARLSTRLFERWLLVIPNGGILSRYGSWMIPFNFVCGRMCRVWDRQILPVPGGSQ